MENYSLYCKLYRKDFNIDEDSVMYMKFTNIRIKEVNFNLDGTNYGKFQFVFEADRMLFMTNKDV